MCRFIEIKMINVMMASVVLVLCWNLVVRARLHLPGVSTKKIMDASPAKFSERSYEMTTYKNTISLLSSSGLHRLDFSAKSYRTEHEFYINLFSEIDGTTAVIGGIFDR